MMLQATQKKRQPAAMTVRFVFAGIVFGVLMVGIASAISATGKRGGHLFPDLKIGFNIRW
ncbi:MULTISPECIES: hypothetical protein [Ensifer]|jgi:hypothetical protein|uniref:Uncharacterized protein n=1 Tax=Ensifer canadensis TaxID=555315 RepID=A0AAW4FLF3_9HYPH|nr:MULTISPECIES: hypothetical protein [Ensifer]MDP9630921.1 hypothetical protein [Ensifer adhaerens]KQW54228.1 hypothetical protein ASD02_30995 [Ensifer sp. Root1252]KQY78916.1 hypothetical protein ASD52_03570 [Ensifer sp. Root142]KRC70490.1 hypothetical protein ASE32_34145 [Ensifer sp. Root231]KRC95276.1 hypothetical protein ASE47_33310 [Ensifer sp. Root258]